VPKSYVHKATGGVKMGGGARIEYRRRSTKKGRRYSLETVEGIETRRDGTGFVEIHRVIDRENDLYIERVIDPNTGKVLHNVEEPLSKHTDRGTVRRTGKTKK
jgi:hypothetical protein